MRLVVRKDRVLYKKRDKIKSRWTEHFTELLNPETSVAGNALDSIPQAEAGQESPIPPTLQEMQNTVGAMKSSKAAGPHHIPIYKYKFGDILLIHKLSQFFGMIWKT